MENPDTTEISLICLKNNAFTYFVIQNKFLSML